MHEYIARPVYYALVHLFFASLVWSAAWALTRLSRGSAAVKYWVWVATSFNFVLPLGAVLDKSLVRHLAWARPLGVIGELGVRAADNAMLVGSLWLAGAVVMAVRLGLRIKACRRHAGTSVPTPVLVVGGMPVRFTSAESAPTVDGVLRQHISLPDGIDQVLTRSELDAVLLHELVHARRRDNLVWLIHEVSLCLLWFQPLVWMTGRRMALYRELSCDESVIERAHGRDLVRALAKLATPEGGRLLQASASSFVTHRLERLGADSPPISFAPNAFLVAVFGCTVLAGIFETVAHTACCFAR